MKRRSKESRKYYEKRIHKMIEEHPEVYKIQYIYKSLGYLLKEKYPEIIDAVSRDTMIEFLKDAVYLDRIMRTYRQGKQKELKKLLAQETQVQLGYTI